MNRSQKIIESLGVNERKDDSLKRSITKEADKYDAIVTFLDFDGRLGANISFPDLGDNVSVSIPSKGDSKKEYKLYYQNDSFTGKTFKEVLDKLAGEYLE